ncbi:MAG TPA: DUF2098 family protein [Methanobacterium sp.]|nr:DUF2098 family protein [Methanobacterium sp.]
MDVLDVNGNKICSGLYVKYIGTHTIGKVDKIVIKNEIPWIKLDSSGLYYRSDYIEIIEDKKHFIKQNKPRKIKSKPEKFDIKIPVEISDTTDGPGIGGG